MRKLFIVLGILILAAAIAMIFMDKKGYSFKAIINAPKTRSLEVDCGKVHRLVVTSTVRVTVYNHSDKKYKRVKVHITAYGKDDEELKEKTIAFERDLPANDSLSKIVTLKGKARTCTCVIEDATPE